MLLPSGFHELCMLTKHLILYVKLGSMNKIVYNRLHTLPLYESIEALQLLPHFHRYCNNDGLIEKVTKGDIVFATAGSKGIIRLWKTKRAQEEVNGISKITGLLCIAEQEPRYAFGNERGGYTGLLLTSHKHQLRQQNIEKPENDVQVQTNEEELIAIDAEHNFSFVNLLEVKSMPMHPPLLGLNRTIVGHNDEILDLKIIPGNDSDDSNLPHKRVAVATNSSQIRIFELSSFSCVVLDGHTDTVLSIDVSPCGNFLATSGKDKTTRIWNLRTHTCMAIATGHTEAIGATALSRKIGRYEVAGKAAFNGAGSFLITASKDKTLKRWNLPGSSVLEKNSSSENCPVSLSVFTSVRAHEKVRLSILIKYVMLLHRTQII